MKKAQEIAPYVIPLVRNSNQLLEDLRRLNQLKDADIQNDLNMEKMRNPRLFNPSILKK